MGAAAVTISERNAGDSSILDGLAKLVNETGIEIAVTLLVGGAVVSGLLTATQRFLAWHQTQIDRLSSTAPDTVVDAYEGAGPPTTREIDEIVAAWRSSVQRGDAPGRFPALVLRDVFVLSSGGTAPVQYPFLLIRSAAVDGFTFGTTRQG